jgi:hypothetical protein
MQQDLSVTKEHEVDLLTRGGQANLQHPVVDQREPQAPKLTGQRRVGRARRPRLQRDRRARGDEQQ